MSGTPVNEALKQAKPWTAMALAVTPFGTGKNVLLGLSKDNAGKWYNNTHDIDDVAAYSLKKLTDGNIKIPMSSVTGLETKLSSVDTEIAQIKLKQQGFDTAITNMGNTLNSLDLKPKFLVDEWP